MLAHYTHCQARSGSVASSLHVPRTCATARSAYTILALWHSIRTRPLVNPEPMQLGASAPTASHRFVAPGLHACRLTIAAAPSIDATSASVTTTTFWGTTSPHPVIGSRIPSPAAGARIPCTVDAQISAAAGRACYGSPSPAVDVHGSFVDLLRR
jgi:hypothetical protein